MTEKNEAAERLLDQLLNEYRMTQADKRLLVKRTLAAERRATVERIRKRLVDGPSQVPNYRPIYWLQAILDEEAAL